MKLNSEQMRALEIINNTDSCGVALQMGYTKDGYCRDGLLIKTCPPVIINKLIENGYRLDLTEMGLLVTK